MKVRAAALAVLAALVALTALSTRRRGPAAGGRRPRRRRGGVVARGVAVACLVLAVTLMLAALSVWRLAPAAGREVDSDRFVTEPVAAAMPTPPTATPLPSPTIAPESGPGAAAQEWRLLAGGDVLMDLSEAAGIDPFAGVVPPFAGAELTAVNVEMAIATGGTPERKSFVFRAPPSAAQTMAAAGIDVGSLANNHSLDYGLDALLETIAGLRAAGVAPVGAGANEKEAYAPASFEIAGVRVGVIGASRVLPRTYWAAGVGGDPGLASAYAEGRLVEAVRSARASHDVVIVMVHWGVEGAPCPNADQERLGSALLEAGASVVLGSHPHVLQPIVQRDGGLIAYSLGNLVWHPLPGSVGETGVLEVRFEGAQVSGYELHPHVLDGRGVPFPAEAEAAARIEAAVGAVCP